MNSSSGEFHRAAKAKDIAPGRAKQVRIGERVLAIYIDGDVVECPLHQGCFHIPTGKALGPLVTQDIRTYPVKVVSDEIYVETPAGGA